MRYILTLIAALIVAASPALARPITYPGGWAGMMMNDGDMNALHILYSPSARYSVGVLHEYRRGPEAHMDSLGGNLLLKRWNNPASQGNIYLNAGAGIAYDGDVSEPLVYGSLSADWEDRRYYVSYENRFLSAGNIERFAEHKARVGIAPYIAPFGSLHSWVMLQADYKPADDRQFTTTPLIRMFKGPALWEAGYNIQNETALFNLMLQF